MTNPVGLLKEDERRQGIPSRMGTTSTRSPGSITGTATRMGRVGMEARAGEGGTTLMAAGAESTIQMVLRQRRGEGTGATAVMEGRVTDTTIILVLLRTRPMMCEDEERKGGIATITPTVLKKRKMG